MSKNFGLEDLWQILRRNVGLGLDPTAGESPEQQTLEELGVDSLGALEIQTTVMDTYGVRLPDEILELTGEHITAHVRDELTTTEG
ncbi:acyl carrier protein [Nocardia sp. alder85J]|uniref:acyl carrier protein n=1 Tax=Nocardia sp. alder85J TaxID=2862949 RepID=UPI001CD29D9E|nr:acyl carrier protein [Nocardia sp. alder85J]MCX4094704.1 acyl carrier protein [Nocardia sp. alder85J]